MFRDANGDKSIKVNRACIVLLKQLFLAMGTNDWGWRPLWADALEKALFGVRLLRPLDEAMVPVCPYQTNGKRWRSFLQDFPALFIYFCGCWAQVSSLVFIYFNWKYFFHAKYSEHGSTPPASSRSPPPPHQTPCLLSLFRKYTNR